NQLVVSSSHTIYLIDSSTGELLEKLGSESLPEGKIKRIDLLENGLLLETSSGIFQSNADFTLFSPHAQVHLPPLHFQTPPAALLSRILQDWRGQGIHLERILLDLHTGRIFGSLGSYLLDLVGIATLILLYSGISLWWRIPRK
ncbi:MAG: PepSY domain-containing protein, partial [Bdellovibrionales bacterium]|nr:PepSY domain-containing protein [Bdellovibrionales bacterium]